VFLYDDEVYKLGRITGYNSFSTECLLNESWDSEASAFFTNITKVVSFKNRRK
jgi:hypothetical protein